MCMSLYLYIYCDINMYVIHMYGYFCMYVHEWGVQDIRRDFIVNEVTNYELGGHLYAWTLQGEYAARVHDPRTYHAICEVR